MDKSQCAECGRHEGKPDIGKLRLTNNLQFAMELAMLADADILAHCAWTTVPELLRMIRGVPYSLATRPRGNLAQRETSVGD